MQLRRGLDRIFFCDNNKKVFGGEERAERANHSKEWGAKAKVL